MRIKAVQLAVQSALPESMQGQEVPLTAKGISALMYRVAIEHPEQYSAVLKKVGDLGRNAAYWQGETVGLDDLRDALDTRPYFKVMDKEVRDAQKGVTDPDKRDAIRERIWAKMATLLEKDTMKAALASGNSLGRSVASGARGKPLQLRAMLATPALFEDSKGRMIPIFARNSYGRGISPGAFLAGTYGARSSVVSTKTATAKGGFLGKQMAQTMAGLVVTEDDCGTTNGIDLPITDRSLRNRFLARKTGSQEPGSLLDRKALSRLRDGKVDTLLVRSPMTCKAARGVCGKCVGADPTGKLPEIGFAAGVTAANAISEPLTQMALNVKHCLLQGTLVRMADLTVKPIESIRPGDWVLGADITGATFPVQVKHLWDQGVQDVQTYVFHGRERTASVRCTEEHPILTISADDSVPARRRVASSDILAAMAVEGEILAAYGALDAPTKGACWDLTVDHPDELFVLANGLIVKNTSGASKEKKSYSGLDWLIRFVQIPEEFPDRAPVAEQDGDVAISVAPQGGHIVRVGEAEHYVPQHLPLLVKNGQTVEAGTPLSQGVMRPDDIVRLRGLGEGRRYMATRFKEMLDDSGTEADSRNVEMLARASVNHVRILDTDQSEGGILPDDVVPYDEQERHYEPPEDALPGKPSTSLGQFLHTPALHYSIGTRITPSVAERLEKTGFDKVLVSPNAPGFTPEMPRLQTATFAQPDWMAAMGTSYLKRQLSQRAQRGQDSNIKSNIHFAPRLAVGEDFGRNIRTTGEF